jgi:hypothetical protein
MKRNAPNVVELELSTVKIDVILVTLVLRKQDSQSDCTFSNRNQNNCTLYIFDKSSSLIRLFDINFLQLSVGIYPMLMDTDLEFFLGAIILNELLNE